MFILNTTTVCGWWYKKTTRRSAAELRARAVNILFHISRVQNEFIYSGGASRLYRRIICTTQTRWSSHYNKFDNICVAVTIISILHANCVYFKYVISNWIIFSCIHCDMLHIPVYDILIFLRVSRIAKKNYIDEPREVCAKTLGVYISI